MTNRENNQASDIRKRKRNSPAYVVLNHLAGAPADRRTATRILDIPAGEGVLLVPLAMAGFDVTGCDLFPEYSQAVLAAAATNGGNSLLDCWRHGSVPGLVKELLARPAGRQAGNARVVKGDMEDVLPFENSSFDLVVCLEGIEHIDKQESFLKETRRILRRSGRLILSTPNVLCLRSRLAYALTGQRTLKTFIDEYTTVQDRDQTRTYHGHVFLVSYFELRYILSNAGFRIRAVLPTRLSATSVILAPFMLPFIFLSTRWGMMRARRRFRAMKRAGKLTSDAEMPYPEIMKHVLSVAGLFGCNLIVEAEAV